MHAPWHVHVHVHVHVHSHAMHAPCQAHESAVWSLAWHPLGHLLASGSNDHSIKFWCRSRPGDGKKRAREDEGKEEPRSS